MKAELRDRCHMPVNGDLLELTSDTHISSLKLKDSLLAHVQFVQVMKKRQEKSNKKEFPFFFFLFFSNL